MNEGSNVFPGLTPTNTQMPKVIGLARLHELSGIPRHASAARFFHKAVLEHHSYVIGGNSEREHFGKPDVVAPLITDRTCESCNSYNMLKLSRHLYSWDGEASHFDYYERAHLNHIMAHQHPKTGQFVYFMPLGAGARRTYSTAEDSFWCCVGSGLESHSKHGDSIYWHDDETLYVNLFIASSLDWKERDARVEIDTDYPFSEDVVVTLARFGSKPLAIALRLPGGAMFPRFRSMDIRALQQSNGYAVLDRRWRKAIGRQTLPAPFAPADARRSPLVHSCTARGDRRRPGTAADGMGRPAPALCASAAKR